MKINDKTQIIGSISIKKNKLGPIMHNSAYDYLGMNFVYLELETTDCKNAINGIKALNFKGSAISMPYKEKVIKYIDKIDPIAKKIGAVNTILNNNGTLEGYNSDWIGAINALKEITPLQNKRVVLLGAGGAAKAIAYGLTQNKAKVIIFNRNIEKAKKLAKEFNLVYGGNLGNLREIKDYDILINATSVGFYPEEGKSPVSKDSIKENKIVMDVVFYPLESKFTKDAKSKGCEVILGYKMLIHQALFQFKLWTGKEAPFKVMEEALLKILK